MICRAILLWFLLLVSFGTAAATELSVGEGLFLQFDLPEGWEVTSSPPVFLVDELAGDIGHETAGRGQAPTADQLREAAEERLAENEAFVCRPDTGACLIIDFSPLKPGEASAGSSEVERSAAYAAEGMKSEENVEVFHTDTVAVRIPGADAAHKLEVDYRHHDHPMKFFGIVGFADPYWFYLYYTDPLADPADLRAARGLFGSLRLRRGR